MVNLPDPARFAIHKMEVSQRRPLAFAAKSRKDIQQVTQLLTVLLDIQPGAVVIAIEEAQQYGNKFYETFLSAVNLLPNDLQQMIAKKCEEYWHRQ